MEQSIFGLKKFKNKLKKLRWRKIEMEKVKSYANIAIIKYWGKKDKQKMIPATSSISLTLKDLYTETEIEFIDDAEIKKEVEKNGEKFSGIKDLFFLNSELQDKIHTEKISKVVDLFRTQENEKNKKVKIKTTNNMPTAAGLSSSSSGLSAIIKACNKLFKKNLSQEQLAQISKYGSGSSARSFFGPVAAWDKDSGEIYKVKTDLKLAMIVLVLSKSKKDVSSRDGMERCVKTSTYFEEWVEQSEIDFENMKKYLQDNDFEKVGKLTEENALRMHRTTETSNPPFSYFLPQTYKAMEFVKNLRDKDSEKCYFTMDAGPNVKVLCLEEDLERLAGIFSKKYEIIVSRTVEL